MSIQTVVQLLTSLKNAQKAGKKTANIPFSAFKHGVAQALQRGGYLKNIEKKGKRTRKSLSIELQSPEDDGKLIQNVRFFSTPGRKQYAGHRELRRSRRGGVIILSTPQGIMSGKEAKKARVGGLLIAEIW